MCFQKLIRYVCGHVELVEEECERAEDISFYIKVNCIDYQSLNVVSGWRCGLGAFYCKQAPGGRQLENLHHRIDNSLHQLTDVTSQLEKVRLEITSFNSRAAVLGWSQEFRQSQPDFHILATHWKELLEKRKTVTIWRYQLLSMSKEAISFYRGRTQQLIVADQPVSQPADDFIGYARQQHHTHLRAQYAQFSQQQNGVLPQPGLQQPLRLVGSQETANIGPLQDGAPTQNAMRPYHIGSVAMPPTVNQTYPLVPVIDAKQGGRPKKAKPAKQDTPNPEALGLRRSTRARKQVRYADSEASSVQSREPSPAKSDISRFSPPPKSEGWQSPATKHATTSSKRPHTPATNVDRVPASGGTLGTIISDWHRMNEPAVAAIFSTPLVHPDSGLVQENIYASTTAVAEIPKGPLQDRPPPDYIKNLIAKRSALDEGHARKANASAPSPSEKSHMRPPTRHDAASDSTQGQISAHGPQHAAIPGFLPLVPTMASHASTAPKMSSQAPMGEYNPRTGRFVVPNIPLQYSYRDTQLATGQSDSTSSHQAQSGETRADNPLAPATEQRKWLLNTPMHQSSNPGSGISQPSNSGQPGAMSPVSAPRPDSVITGGRLGGTGINTSVYTSGCSIPFGQAPGYGGSQHMPTMSSSFQHQFTRPTSVRPLAPGGSTRSHDTYSTRASMPTLSDTTTTLMERLRNREDSMRVSNPIQAQVMPASPPFTGYTPTGERAADILNSASGVPAPSRDYDHLRRSFSATANLTPPSAPGNTDFDSDPRKRALPPSSPEDSPVKKRVRLSLPGDDASQSNTRRSSRSEFEKATNDDDIKDEDQAPAPISALKTRKKRSDAGSKRSKSSDTSATSLAPPKTRKKRKDAGMKRSGLSQTLALPAEASELSGYEGGAEEEVAVEESLGLPASEGEMLAVEFTSEIDWIEGGDESEPGS